MLRITAFAVATVMLLACKQQGEEPSKVQPPALTVYEHTDGSASVVEGVRPAATKAAKAGLQCSALGPQKMAVLLVNQPSAPFQLATYPVGYWKDEFFSKAPKSARSYLAETSYGRTSLTGNVFGPINLPQDYSCSDFYGLTDAAIDAARNAGVDFSPYTRVGVVFTPVGACTYNAAAEFGCRDADAQVPNQYSRLVVVTHPNASPDLAYSGRIVHELGHNFGLTHSDALDFGTVPLGALDYSLGTTDDVNQGAPGAVAWWGSQGDPFSAMGLTGYPHSFSARDKLFLGWLPPSDYREVLAADEREVKPYERSHGLRALRVLREPTNFSWLWMEYRQPIGAYDSDISNVPIANVFNGALVRYEDNPSLASSQITDALELLHFNPGSNGAPNQFYFAAMNANRAFVDPYSPLRLEVTDRDSTSMTVSVQRDVPCAELQAEFSDPDLVIDVTAPANCAWQASTTAAWLTLVGPGDGQGNGSVTYQASANPEVTQRRAYVTVNRQSVLVAQKGSGTFVHPMQQPHVVGRRGGVAAVVEFPASITEADVFGSVGECLIRVHYLPPSAPTLHLTGEPGELAPGSAGTISNEHCTLRGTGSDIQVSGDQISIVWDLELAAEAGSFPIAVGATDAGNGVGPFVIGTWSIDADLEPTKPPGGGGAFGAWVLLVLAGFAARARATGSP